MSGNTVEDLANKDITPIENKEPNKDDINIQDSKNDFEDLQNLQKQLEEDLTLKDIRKEKRILKREIRKIGKTGVEMGKVNELTFGKVLLLLDLEDRKNFNTYLKKVINKEIDPTKEKFQPKNEESFIAMLQQMPYLAGYVQFKLKTPSKQSNNNVVGADTRVVDLNPASVTYANGTRKTNVGSNGFNNINTSDDATFGEAYTEHGVRGLIKKGFDYMPNMTENQKDGRTNALFLGGMGFAIFKLGKRFFTGAKNEKGEKVGPGFLGRLAIAGGVFLGSNMLTGKSPIELIDKALNGGMSRDYLKGQWGEAANKASETAKERVVFPLDVTRLFGKTKIAELGLVLNDDFKIKNYDILVQKAQSEQDQDSLTLLQKIGKEDRENQIRKGLEAMGVTPENYKDFGDKTVEEIYMLYNSNISKAKTFIEENNLILDTENKDKNKKYKDLISSGKEITDADLQNLVTEGVLYEQVEIKKDSNREQLKEKVNNLEDGKILKIKIKGEDAELSKINGTSEVELKSKNGKITKINLDLPSIIGLGDGDDRKFIDKNDNGDIYATILSAHTFNGFKNRYENRKYAAGGEKFEFTNGKIYFNESKTGTTEINKIEVMDDGIKGLFSDFPDTFKGQEQQIVNYLNKKIELQNQSIEDVIKEFNNKNIQIELSGDDLNSHGETTKIDKTNKKIVGLDNTEVIGPNRQFENYSDLIGAANLINFFKKFLRDRQAQGKDPIYIGVDGNIAFNDRTIYEEMKSYANRGQNGFGDSDLIQSGELFFWKLDSLKNVSPTLYAHRKEFVQYLNNTEDLFKEYIPEDKEAKKLAEIKEKIAYTLNEGIIPPIDFGVDSMEYDKEHKKLIIKGINEKNIQNDKLIENLGKLNNLVSRYDLFDSEYVNKIELPNINIEPGKTISIKYLKKLLDFNPEKVQLGPNMLKNKDMIKYVVDKKYSEGRFKIEENTNLDMNGIIILNYIYKNDYDFDRIFNGERDSRLDFTMRVMQLLSDGQTIIDPDNKKELLKIKGKPITLKPNHDPIMEWRRVAKGENVNYADDIRRGIRNRFFTARNDNILEKIAKYYNEDYPNIADTNPNAANGTP